MASGSGGRREAFERSRVEGTETTWALRSLLWAYNDVTRQLARHLDLGVNDVAALEHLMERPELGPGDLAALLVMSTASATVLVDRLEQAGHLERHPHPSDRRRRSLRVTDHAMATMFGALQPLFEALITLDAELSDRDKVAVSSYLRGVAEIYDHYTAGLRAER